MASIRQRAKLRAASLRRQAAGRIESSVGVPSARSMTLTAIGSIKAAVAVFETTC